eukprot:6328088-Amphidinium_carterae.1
MMARGSDSPSLDGLSQAVLQSRSFLVSQLFFCILACLALPWASSTCTSGHQTVGAYIKEPPCLTAARAISWWGHLVLPVS